MFNFSCEIIREFTEKYCWFLAKLLSIEIKCPIYGIKEYPLSTNIKTISPHIDIHFPPSSDEILHYVVLYQNKFIDIRGMWTQKLLLDNWKQLMIEDSTINQNFEYKLVLIKIENLPNYSISDEIYSLTNQCIETIIKNLNLL